MYRYDHPDNLVALIEDSISRFPDNPLFGTKNEQGTYTWSTYAQVGQRIDDLRGGLAAEGIGPGDAVGIIANNRLEWAVAAFATFGLGARFIPMYERELVQIWRYIINDGDIRLLLVANTEIYAQIQNMRAELPGLKKVVLIDGQGRDTEDTTANRIDTGDTMAALEATGRANPKAARHPATSDIAVLIYTSGTTGNPKGVLLSHGNFTTNVDGGAQMFPDLNHTSRSLSILPWAHSYGQTAELYYFIKLGASIGFVEDVTTIAADMELVKPTFIIAVPRVFNKIYDGLWIKFNQTGGVAKKLFVMGVENAKRKRMLAANGDSELVTNLKYKLADAIVFKKIRAKMGGQLRGALTGSATMNADIGRFFEDIGLPVYDCYGLTETSPAVTMSSPGAHLAGSVGRPIDQVRVVIDKSVTEPEAKDGEVLVYGPNVMQGYHNQPEATADAMTADGGFRTGDRGWLDENGFLFITGRIKEQYKLENGKYVFPATLEEEIRLLPWIENAMVFGDGRPYNVCLVVPDFTHLVPWAREQGLPDTPAQLVQSEAAAEMIGEAVKTHLAGKFGGYEIPRSFILVAEDFSVEDGTLTQTLKLKRREVIKRWRDHLEAAYGPRPSMEA